MDNIQIKIPLQSYGLGDIIFCMSIINKWINDGCHVIWSVEPVYLPIAKHFPWIILIDKNLLNINYNIKETVTTGNAKIIPLRWSNDIQKVSYDFVMSSKYDMMDLNWKEWKKGFSCNRDYESEHKLYFDVLGLQLNEKYNLISEHYQTAGKIHSPLHVDNGLKNVQMKFINGFTMFDWLTVMQNATTIHAVASSNIYLFELYEMDAKEIHLYPRKPEENNHDHYKYLLTKKYQYHD